MRLNINIQEQDEKEADEGNPDDAGRDGGADLRHVGQPQVGHGLQVELQLVLLAPVGAGHAQVLLLGARHQEHLDLHAEDADGLRGRGVQGRQRRGPDRGQAVRVQDRARR